MSRRPLPTVEMRKFFYFWWFSNRERENKELEKKNSFSYRADISRERKCLSGNWAHYNVYRYANTKQEEVAFIYSFFFHFLELFCIIVDILLWIPAIRYFFFYFCGIGLNFWGYFSSGPCDECNEPKKFLFLYPLSTIYEVVPVRVLPLKPIALRVPDPLDCPTIRTTRKWGRRIKYKK